MKIIVIDKREDGAPVATFSKDMKRDLETWLWGRDSRNLFFVIIRDDMNVITVEGGPSEIGEAADFFYTLGA